MTEPTPVLTLSGRAPRSGPRLAMPVARRTLAAGLAVLLSVYLGLSGGGYDIILRSEIGLLAWWFVLLGVLIGALPRARVPAAGWIAVTLLAGFLIWTWIGLNWTSSHELTLDEVCRLSTYLGIFLLGVCVLDRDTAPWLVGGLAGGIAVVSLIAVLSKLTPGLFPADTARTFYQTPRLSYPFNYPDGVGEYAALGLPLLLYVATGARSITARALATAALAPVLLCLAMTVSRGGILAAFVGLVAFLALVPDRIPRLPTLAIVAAGIALLMLALLHRPAVRDSLAPAPAAQRDSMLVILGAVMAASAAAQALAIRIMRGMRRPRLLQVSRRGAQAITAAIILAVLCLVLVAVVTGTAGNLWHQFKLWQPTRHSNQYFRLLSLAGSHRYQYWQVAWKAFLSSPLHGIGAGTFRLYWFQHTTHAEYVLNAHSLWFETLAETGIVGWLLLAGFFALVLVGGAIRALRAPADLRLLIASATAGVVAFCGAASFDWDWQIGVIPMVALLLAAVTLVHGPARSGEPAASGPRAQANRLRLLLAPGAVLALILIAIPLASTAAVYASQAAVARGDLRAALGDADLAQAIEPGAASPYLQRALVLEKADNIGGAARQIAAAIRHDRSDYQLWMIAMRIATESDHPRRALADYRRAEALYPTSTYFNG